LTNEQELVVYLQKNSLTSFQLKIILMKRLSAFVVLFMCFLGTIDASASDYHPLLKEGKVWNMYYSNYSRSYELTICVRIIGDTIVDNEQCYKATSETIDRATGNAISKGGSVAVFLEKDRKVFERRNDNWRLLYDSDQASNKMLKDGKQWIYKRQQRTTVGDEPMNIVTKVVFTLDGDTIIDNRRYAKLYRQEEDENPEYWMALREEGTTIYEYAKDATEEKRHIEFNPRFFNETGIEPPFTVATEEIDCITVNGRPFIRHTYKDDGGASLIAVEGIGYQERGVLDMNFEYLKSDILSFESCYENSEFIFSAADFYKSGDTTDIKATNHVQRTKNNVLFDLQGLPIQGSPKHGVYIQNGKKVMR
jgi:hypothetical protein